MTESEALVQQLRGLSTEGSDPRFATIDQMSSRELAAVMNTTDAEVPRAIAGQLDAIAAAIDAVVERMARGGRLRYVGAGTAGRMAVVDASECPPTYSTPPELIQAVLAGGGAAMTNSVEGAEDDADAGAAAMAAHDIGPDDVVVGVTASGRTPFVIGALTEAGRRGALTVGLSCNGDAELSKVVEHGLEVVVGNEVVAGSTRLKAGTAQKLVLNMISTITMVRLGHTHGNYMVDMRVLNEKLAARAARMVAEITGADLTTAAETLGRAGNHIKSAIVMIEHDVDADTARERLAAAGGRLSKALANKG
ncbi:N-acetylmuramic acid 6-phosphate etherase [Stackebrandtia nassauensis]|uniref:N-acetylmuramic acid 6-phosphate etherase n=1 Tax=Stackebrandtia nassauensis (strain DSM 44728 / CIP 108903 / NRRL B-16338 / NBRC 102104 / LLR-40K-21) TaxID=446470 RepID=D3Q1A5_STANL|nr:N-acetylmuramic acid 6-phosphate etherase [Stackebrandtia nassauensis]ADD45685.1 glucokinase regulatory-like protein [Stackebrandtia nassauensis DSM 44728]